MDAGNHSVEGEEMMQAIIDDCVATAVLAERERCAAIAEGMCKTYPAKIARYRKKGDTVAEGLFESALFDCLAIAADIREAPQ